MILLDTNVISELMRPTPDQNVVNWVSSFPKMSLFTSAITEAEILYGVAILSKGKRKSELLDAVLQIFNTDLKGHVLPFDSNAASAYASIASIRKRIGKPISQFDAQIAAIAQSRGSAVATRNINDFHDCGIDVINPWNQT